MTSRPYELGWRTSSPSWGKKGITGATVVFLDESGFSVKANRTTTWAPRGETPTIKARASWEKLSTIGAITTKGQFLQHTLTGSIKALNVITFLEHLLLFVPGEVVVVLDNAGIHRAKVVKDFVAAHERLSVVFLPPYAPELNPMEKVWAYVKRFVLGNACPRDLRDLKRLLGKGWMRVRDKRLAARFLHAFLPSRPLCT